MNILFIMYDQLRFDYLSCTGHPYIKTPNFDKIASMGVNFTNTYVQSPICGASRMSFYTGRYTSSHGAHWNGFPLRVGEITLGDHLRNLGMDCWLIGKTHMRADAEGMARLGLSPDSIIGARQAECGFDVWKRDDGLWAQGPDGIYGDGDKSYNEFLKSKGYEGENPWADYANASIEDGKIASGWFLTNADKPANIREEDSETPWLTNEAISFMEHTKEPWCAHVSYIKPHWPYIVPSPYHKMYGQNQILPATRHPVEKENTHPVYNAFLNNKIAKAFQNDEARAKVIPAYMGLIKQCDDQLERIINYLEETGKIKDTVIVLTSDHGDYLGDHWLGEKDLFHEPSVKIPLIIYDPRASADKTRGTTCSNLVESIDLSATFIEMAGGTVPDHIIEGKSLIPFLNGTPVANWREVVFSEYDYSITPMAKELGVQDKDARLFMVFDGRYKLIHAEGGFRPILFDLENDPDEFQDLGKQDNHKEVIKVLYAHLAQWGRRMSQRVTKSAQDINNMRGAAARKGILPFLVDGSEVEPELISKYLGQARKNYLDK